MNPSAAAREAPLRSCPSSTSFLPGSRVLALLLGIFLASCLSTHPWVEAPPPWTRASLEGSRDARVTLRGEAPFVLAHPVIEEDQRGRRLVGLAVEGRDAAVRRELPLEDVVRLETNRFSRPRLVFNVLVWGAAIVGVVFAAVAVAEASVIGSAGF